MNKSQSPLSRGMTLLSSINWMPDRMSRRFKTPDFQVENRVERIGSWPGFDSLCFNERPEKWFSRSLLCVRRCAVIGCSVNSCWLICCCFC